MSLHKAKISWKRTTSDFVYETYDRSHQIEFEGGIAVQASAAPDFSGNAQLVNPEEMLAAALSSCHMLTFLAIAARSRLVVESYEDSAVAHLSKNAQGKLAVTRVELNPKVKMSGELAGDKYQAMHDKAHHNCFIAGAVSCEVALNPTLV